MCCFRFSARPANLCLRGAGACVFAGGGLSASACEAVEEFQHALDLNPNFAAAHGYLGNALGQCEPLLHGLASTDDRFGIAPGEVMGGGEA
jgi:hypothetical protein